MIGKIAAQLVAEAKAQGENLSSDDVAGEIARGNAVLVDIRAPEEMNGTGTIPWSLHASR